jgi:hypothetical protein
MISGLSRPALLTGNDGSLILALDDVEVWVDKSGLTVSLSHTAAVRIIQRCEAGELLNRELFLEMGKRRMAVVIDASDCCLRPTGRLELRNSEGEWIVVEAGLWFNYDADIV